MARFSFLEFLMSFVAKAEPLPPSTCDEMPEEPDLHHPPIIEQHPKGKGVFVQTVKRATKGGKAGDLAEFAVDLGLDWAMLLCLWQHDDRNRFYLDVNSAAAALRVRDIEPWIWGWPHPDRIDIFVAHMADMLESTKAAGIVLNVEKPFYGRAWRKKPRHAKAAIELMTKLRARVGEAVPIGLSSYGAKHAHESSFPWTQFAAQCDFGMPQIYDSKHKYGPEYPQRCMDSWRKDFEIVLPTWGASKAHTPQQMREMATRTPLAPAVSWWDCNHLRYSAGRQKVVAQYEMPDA